MTKADNERDLLQPIVKVVILPAGLDARDLVLALEQVVADLSAEVGNPRENMPTPNADYVLQSEEESSAPPSIRKKPLDNSYTRYCLFCDSRVHKNNTVGICPGCYAQGKRLDLAPVSQSTLK